MDNTKKNTDDKTRIELTMRELIARSKKIDMHQPSRDFLNSAAKSPLDCIEIKSHDMRHQIQSSLREGRNRYRRWLNEVKDEDFDDMTLLRMDLCIELVRVALIKEAE